MSNLCTGFSSDNGGAARLRASKAYCDGMFARAKDTPIGDNPHVDLSEAWDSWNAGWTLANVSTGGNMPKGDNGCCAYPGAIPA